MMRGCVTCATLHTTLLHTSLHILYIFIRFRDVNVKSECFVIEEKIDTVQICLYTLVVEKKLGFEKVITGSFSIFF